jgi:beta-xylosidase
MHSSDLRTWPATPTEPTDPLPTPNFPRWATTGTTWAPVVVEDNGQYLMYYTVRQVSSGRQCISVATASTPGGPFADSSVGPLVCQLDHFGSIDPSVFTSGGTRYLLWKSDDNAVGLPTHLWGQQLGATGHSLVGRPRRLLDQTENWQVPAIEGPDMIAVGSTYYLFYGAGPWDTGNAAIGYAICYSPLGPCSNQSVGQAWLASRPGANGPSGPAAFRDLNGVTRLAYHAWPDKTGYGPIGNMRTLFIDTLTFVGGRPTLG